jgi:hypothetical protein
VFPTLLLEPPNGGLVGTQMQKLGFLKKSINVVPEKLIEICSYRCLLLNPRSLSFFFFFLMLAEAAKQYQYINTSLQYYNITLNPKPLLSL